MLKLKKFMMSRTALLLAIIVIVILSVVTTVVVIRYSNDNQKSLNSAVSKNATEEEIKKAYLDILERPADRGGIAVYSKMPIAEVRDDLMASKERKTLEANKNPVTVQPVPVSQTIKTVTVPPVNQPTKTVYVPVVKQYVASVCTETKIPFETTYTDDDTMYIGETRVGLTGRDGYIKTCTADSNGYKPSDIKMTPFNAHIYVGTKPTGPTQAELNQERQLRIASCVNRIKMLSPGSNAYEQCYLIN